MVLEFAAPAGTRARLVTEAKPGWVRGLRGLGGDTPEGKNENVTVLQEGNGRRSGFARIGANGLTEGSKLRSR
jgi:hypothetical protein